MIKFKELTDPNSCMSRARSDEMTFVLLERDFTASATIRFWAKLRVNIGKNSPDDAQIREALQCARHMDKAQGVETTCLDCGERKDHLVNCDARLLDIWRES